MNHSTPKHVGAVDTECMDVIIMTLAALQSEKEQDKICMHAAKLQVEKNGGMWQPPCFQRGAGWALAYTDRDDD